MNPKNLLLAISFTALSCTAQTSLRNGEAPDSTETLKAIDHLVSQPKLLAKEWREMKGLLPTSCELLADGSSVECPSITGLAGVTAQAQPPGIISLELMPPINCEEVVQTITKRIGPGTAASRTDSCATKWRLEKQLQGAYVRVHKIKSKPGHIAVMIGVTQGP